MYYVSVQFLFISEGILLCHAMPYLLLYRSAMRAYLIKQKYTLSLSLQKVFPAWGPNKGSADMV